MQAPLFLYLNLRPRLSKVHLLACTGVIFSHCDIPVPRTLIRSHGRSPTTIVALPPR